MSSNDKITSMISLNQKIINKDLHVDKSGNFKAKINIDLIPGSQQIIVEQRQGKKLTKTTTTILVVSSDEPDKKEMDVKNTENEK